MTALQAAVAVLQEAGGPLHYEEITRRILARGLWKTSGLTPIATISAQVSQSVKRLGNGSPFVRVGKGTYGLRPADPPAPAAPSPTLLPAPAPLSFTDAAERILAQSTAHEPVHYRDLTRQMLDGGLVETSGQTPDATLYASVREEIRRQRDRGERPRFEMSKGGFIGLARWSSEGLDGSIDRHNVEVRRHLHARLTVMDPYAFEALVSELLVALGFDDVQVTQKSADGGIDVRGTLVVGGVVRTRMAVQVKRWKYNVQAPVVQQVRGSLGAHEQGLIITTGGFSSGARDEAKRPDATPVGLMDGDGLVGLLMEHEIGVRRRAVPLFDLDGTGHDATDL